MKTAREYMPEIDHILNTIGAVARYVPADDEALDDEIDIRLTPKSVNAEWDIQITGVAECHIAENFYNPEGEIDSILHHDSTYENPGRAADAIICMCRERLIIELANEAAPIPITAEAAAHAMETCTRVDDDDYGSERQIKAENAFFDAVTKRLTPDQETELERWGLKATPEENINYALQLAGIKHMVSDQHGEVEIGSLPTGSPLDSDAVR